MSDNRPSDHQYDEKLAEFTDQILKNEAGEPLPLLAEEEELGRLQRVVLLLKQAGLADHSAVEFTVRLRAVLQKEWMLSGPKASSQKDPLARDGNGFWGQAKLFLKQIQTVNRYRIFTATLLAVALLILVLLPEHSALAGTAGMNSALQWVEFGIGLLCFILLIWLLRRKD
jgi:hypothetical protein